MCMGESRGVLTRCVWVRVREFLPGVYVCESGSSSLPGVDG